MTEVPVRHDECAICLQEIRYFSEFLGLKRPDILEDTLGYDNIEPLTVEPYRVLKQICFDQVRCWVMYGYVNSVVADIVVQEMLQSSRTAAKVEQIALFPAGDLVYNSRNFLEAKVRLYEFAILGTPEISLIVLYGTPPGRRPCDSLDR